MKVKLLILMLLAYAGAFGQTPSGYTKINARYDWIAGKFDSTLHVPGFATTPTLRSGGWTGAGAVGFDSVLHRFFFYSGGSWRRILNASDSTLYTSVKRLQDTAAAIRSAITGGGGTTITDSTLQWVTNNGRKTTDTISSGGLRTKYITSDTSANSNFEIAIFPDLQYMTQTYQSVGRQMFKQTVDSATARNTKAVISVGDLAQTPTTAEMDTVSHWFALLDAANIPNIAIVGNHDYNSQDPASRNLTIYNTYFNPSRYSGASFYGGHFGTDNANYWIKFNAGTKKYLVLGLEFLPRDTVITWAGALLDSVLLADPTREVIVTTHAYQSAYGELSTDTTLYTNNTYGMDATSNNGQDLWDKLLKKKINIKWVFNGHYLINPAQPVKGLTQKIVSVGENGNLINQIFVNFQGDHDGGAGYFMRLQFKPSTGLVDVKFYSSLYNAYDTANSSYSLYDPTIQLESSIGVSGYTSTNDFRVANTAKFEQQKKGSIPYFGADHLLTSDDTLKYDGNILKLLGPASVFSMDSGRYQQYFTGSSTSASTVNIVQPPTGIDTSVYGLSIQKGGNNFDAPRLLFYKTAGAHADVKASTATLNLGDIVVKGVAADNSTILTASLQRTTQTDQDASHIWSKYRIDIPDISGVSGPAFYMQATSSTDLNGGFYGPMIYGANYGSRFTIRTLVDKGYVDSAITASPGSSSGNNLYVRINKTLADSLLWAPNDSTLVGKSIDIVSGDSSVTITKTKTDSTLKYDVRLRADTCALASFAGGGANAGDTTAFSTSTIYGSFFNSLSDTLVITNLRIGLQGTSPSVGVTVYWNDSLAVTAGATKLVNAGNTATNIYTGTSITSFDNTKIPPGVWVWVQTTTVTTKPTYMTATLIGYKKRTQ